MLETGSPRRPARAGSGAQPAARAPAAQAPSRQVHAGQAGGPAPRGHLHQVDAFRVVTFTTVIGVHALGGVAVQAGVAGTAALALMQVTRKAFFCLLAFVSVTSWLRRPTSAPGMWRRRLPVVALPYLVWTAVYGFPLLRQTGGVLDKLTAYAGLLLTGDSMYHMYFLVASLQVYLLLPLVLPFLRNHPRWHLPLLLVSLVGQVGLHAVIEYTDVHSGVVGWYRANCGELALTYQFWLVLGLLAGLHLERVQRVVERHTGALLAAAAAAGAGTVVYVHLAVGAGQMPAKVDSTFSPQLIPWSIAAIAGLYAACSLYATRARRRGRGWRPVVAAAQASFGVYLVHPLLLPYVGNPFWQTWPRTPIALGVVLVTLSTGAVSMLAVALMRRTPLSKALCGRPWLRPAAD